MKHTVALLLTIIALLAPATSQAAVRHALVIGIGRQLDPAWQRINGDKDVEPVVKMLKQNNYTDIHTLVNEKATKNAIVKSFRCLASRCRKGDIVYVHFSGHGQLVTDINGDEPDGWDESWIPYDAFKAYCAKDRGNHHLTDDEVGILLSEIRAKVGPEGSIAVVVDACHSGDSTRGTTPDGVRGTFDRFIIPGKTGAKSPRLPEQWVMISACENYQLNQEFNGMGKLTYIITTYWQNLASKTNAGIVKDISDKMSSRELTGRYPQTPRISGGDHPFSKAFLR